MPFIPHTEQDVEAMLAAIGETSTAALFDEIPDAMRFSGELKLQGQLSEMALMRLMQSRARQDEVKLVSWCGCLRTSYSRGRLGHREPRRVYDGLYAVSG